MDLTDTIRYVAALLLVLGLVGGAGFALKRFGVPGMATGAGRRIKILETLMLGSKHRLMLIRCDTAEHLIVLTPTGASVIAPGMASGLVASSLAATPAPTPVPVPAPAPEAEAPADMRSA